MSSVRASTRRLLPALAISATLVSSGQLVPSSPSAASPWAVRDAPGLDFKDYVEALFLGTGPLTPSNGDHGCSATGVVRGFRPGRVAVVASTTMTDDELSAVERVTRQASAASDGALWATVVQTLDADPHPGPREVTITTHPDASSQGCLHRGGCAIHTFLTPTRPGAFLSTRALVGPDYPRGSYAHETAHGVLGLCHVDGTLIGGPGLSAMSAGPGVYANHIADELTRYDFAAVLAVYQAGIRAGDDRQALVERGLVNP